MMHIEYRTLNYADSAEVRQYLTLLFDISAEGDPYHFEKSREFIDRQVVRARREESSSNTFAGLARAGRQIVALHVLRRIEEGPLVGAHVNGLWVHPDYRRRGIATELKQRGERWARAIGAAFLDTNVLATNERMLALNHKLGFLDYRINLRKRL